MKRPFSALLLAFLLLGFSARAHGDKRHVLGTIEKINSGSVTVKTREGKSVEVKLVDSTVYLARVGTTDKPATVSDLAIGKNVVIHATPKGDELQADEVKVSAAAVSRTPKPKTGP